LEVPSSVAFLVVTGNPEWCSIPCRGNTGHWIVSVRILKPVDQLIMPELSMNWIILIAIVAFLPKNEGFITQRHHLCQDVQCRPGRECGVINGEPSCVCREGCPDHWKPVCGTDGVSYDNHCLLHKAACDSNTHISPTHRRFCRHDRDALIAREEFITQLALLNDPSANGYALPSACFENDRNRLREFLASWLLLSSKKQSWYM